ncbi:MAG TPA: FHA domain-containing protein, partial [bacterium]|nr:FHA domain-containing protein [bacterium]
TKLPESGWLSSSANSTLPNLAHSPVYAAWKHFSQAETKLDYELNGAAMSAIAEYRVEIRGEQRMADTVARLKGEYGKRLVAVEEPAELGVNEFVLRGQEGQGVIRIVLKPKDLKIPTAAEAREVFANFEKNHLPDLVAVLSEGKSAETGLSKGLTLRGRYAQSVLDMVGFEKNAEGKDVFGKNLEAALNRSEKATDPAERTRAAEEVARLVAYLRDVPTLKVEENLIHRSGQLRDFSEIGPAVKWLEASDAKAGKAAWEDYSQLAKYEMELRALGHELLTQIPQGAQKPGNKVYDEYVVARDRLDGALGRLEKVVKSYEGSEAYVKDQATKAAAFKSTAKEEPILEVTDDMLIPEQTGESTKVGRTPLKAKVVGASDKGDDLRLFNQNDIAWLGALGVANAEKLANPQAADYAQTLYNGLDLLLKNPHAEVQYQEWAVTRLVGALRHTAHESGGTWKTWLEDTLNPMLATHGRGPGGAPLPAIPLNADLQAYLGGASREISADNVMEVISQVRARSTQVGLRKYPQAFAPEPQGVEILNLAMKRFGPLIKAKDPKLHEYLEGLQPKAKAAQAFPGTDPAQPNPVAARAGKAGALQGGDFGYIGKLELDASQGLGADLASFLGDRVYLSEQVELPGIKMTPAIRAELKHAEKVFEHGGMVFELQPGKLMFMERTSGAETMNAKPASPQVAKFYEVWKASRSFQPVDAATAKAAYTELKARTDRLGIKLFLEDQQSRGFRSDLEGDIKHHGGALVYLNQLMKLLPDSMLANIHLKQIHLSVPRQGAGLLSSYDKDSGSVYLYSGSFTGARRYMAALLFHELGHSTAERYDPGKTGDPAIPLEVRKTMETAHQTLVDSKAMLGLDWAAGASDRAGYQGSFSEFLAELNLMYVTAGPKLRQHIESFHKESKERMAWDFVYSEMRDRVFQGREYDYSGIAPLPAIQPQAAKPALAAVPAAKPQAEPNRDFIPTKDMADQSVLELVLAPAQDSNYQSKEPHLLIPADPSVTQAQLFGILTKKGSDLWFSPQQKNIRVTDAAGKLRGLRGSQSPVKLDKGDIIEVGFFKFKYDGERLTPDGTLAMRRIDPQPAVAPTTAEAVLQDNVVGAPRSGTINRPATAEYGSVSVHTNEGVGYNKANKPPYNEDGFVQGSNWAIVLDGMGGMGGGDKASAVAGREFQRLMEDPAFKGGMDEAMILAGRKVNEDINGGQAMTGESGTAGVAHRVLKQVDGSYQVQLTVSGDCGAIIFRPDGHGGYEARFRTEEQSLVGDGRRMGAITNTLVGRRNPHANVVTGGMGINREAKPDNYVQTIAPGERLLMFSDGIGDSFSKEELGYLLREAKSPEDAQAKIVDAARLKMARLQKGKMTFADPQQIQQLPDGQNGMINAVAVDGIPGFFLGKDGTVYGRVVEFRDGLGARQYGIEVPWAKGQYYIENARGEGKVIAGTFSGDRGYFGAVDKYKADNLTVHVYFHDVAGAKAPPTKIIKTEPASDPDKTQVFIKPAKAEKDSSDAWTFTLGDKQVLGIGRNVPTGQILLADQTVSRAHAEIFMNQGEFWIRDQGSTSGTFVNGRRVPRDASLALDPGAKLKLGNSSFTFEILANGSARLTPSN